MLRRWTTCCTAVICSIAFAPPSDGRPITYQFFTTDPGPNFGAAAEARFTYPFAPGDDALSADELLTGFARFSSDGGQFIIDLDQEMNQSAIDCGQDPDASQVIAWSKLQVLIRSRPVIRVTVEHGRPR